VCAIYSLRLALVIAKVSKELEKTIKDSNPSDLLASKGRLASVSHQLLAHKIH